MFDTKIIVSSAIGALVALVVYGMVIKPKVEKLDEGAEGEIYE